MLLALSVELLEEIGSKLTQPDRARLRAVCKDIEGATQRLFFSCLFLRIRELRSDDGRDVLGTLASGDAGWSEYAKTLIIKPGNRSGTEEAGEFDISDAAMQDLLASALKTMPNIQTVIWEIHGQDPGWERRIICEYLNKLPALEEVQLEIKGLVDLSSLQLSGIQKFTIKTPSWQRPFNGINAPSEPPMYHEISRLLAQHCLTFLHLEGSKGWSKVWTLLQEKTNSQLHLTEITTNVVTPELFAYLASYSGIHKLKLQFPDGGSRDASDRLADTFYETVLPHHATSLVELSCPAAYESRWSFGNHNVDIVSHLHHLNTLEMSINAGQTRRIDSSRNSKRIDVDGRSVPVVSIGRQVEAEQSDIDPVVALLLHTAATIPALRSLAILPAETESNRGAWCGNGRINHRRAVIKAINTAVQHFTSNSPCSAVVRAGNNIYEMKPVAGEGPAKNGQLDKKNEALLAYHLL
ncbi:hypothetical protein B0H11DRAFT_2046770 [Mycena galericulata]|nr:hypothetical protein B0H11DRAFT_2046770 [Mycena galericulata]